MPAAGARRADRRSQVAGLRLAVALLAAPAAAGVAHFVLFLLLWYGGFHVFEATPRDMTSAIHVSVGLGISVMLLGIAVTGAAVPVLMWMAVRGPLSFRKLLLLGVVLGNLPFAVIASSVVVVQLSHGTGWSDIPRYWYGVRGTVRALAIGSLIGPICAAVFWVVGIFGTDLARGPVSLRVNQ